MNINEWEIVLDEDLWEDGELGFKEVDKKILEGIHITGEYKLIRMKGETNEN